MSKQFDVAKSRARLNDIEAQCQQKRYSASAFSIAHAALDELDRRNAKDEPENRETFAKKLDKLATDLRGGSELNDALADLDDLAFLLYDLQENEELGDEEEE